MRLCLAALLALLLPSPAEAQATILDARYTDPTSRYPHGVLGDDEEWGALELQMSDGTKRRFVLPQSRVFEDTAPRLVDLGGGPGPEIIVVESDAREGARLAIHDADGLVAATPFIGRSFRWLAPVGAADLDGDGAIEIAFVDRPHLAKTLRIWRFDPKSKEFGQVTALQGVTNHRIGERDIAGGIRDCGNGPEMIVADARWRNVLAIAFDGQRLQTTVVGPHKGRSSFAAAMECKR